MSMFRFLSVNRDESQRKNKSEAIIRDSDRIVIEQVRGAPLRDFNK